MSDLLSDLPDELILKTLEYLTPLELARLSGTSKRNYGLTHDKIFMKNFIVDEIYNSYNFRNDFFDFHKFLEALQLKGYYNKTKFNEYLTKVNKIILKHLKKLDPDLGMELLKRAIFNPGIKWKYIRKKNIVSDEWDRDNISFDVLNELSPIDTLTILRFTMYIPASPESSWLYEDSKEDTRIFNPFPDLRKYMKIVLATLSLNELSEVYNEILHLSHEEQIYGFLH